jgi:SAM-dependent methyltransferase
MVPSISKGTARYIFGVDPKAYDSGRVGYPRELWPYLADRCGLHPGSAVFEIGSGTGLATRELIRLGAQPLTIVESSRKMARYLLSSLGPDRSRVRCVVVPFETVVLEEGAFDLGVAANSFHWIRNERVALQRIAAFLRPGGWWASWAQIYGDPGRPSAFHRAIQPLYEAAVRHRDRRRWKGRPVSESLSARARALKSTDRFDRVSTRIFRNRVRLDTGRVVALWSSFSDVARRSRAARERFLEGLARISDEEFGGEVEFTMVVPLVTGRRC